MSTEPSPLPASSTPSSTAGGATPERGSLGLTDLWGNTPKADADTTRVDGPRRVPAVDERPRTAEAPADQPADPRPVDPARADDTDDTAATPVAAAPLAGRREARRRAAADAGPDTAEHRRRRAPSKGKRKVRKVHRVVRHIEVWSLAKMATIFVACGYVVAMVAGYLLWRAADRVGTIEGIEGFMEDSGGYDTFEILGDVVFRASAAIGLVLAVVTVAVIVLGAILFNLISDLTGGIRMTVIDEDLIVAPARRPPAPRPSGASSPPGPPREPGPPTR